MIPVWTFRAGGKTSPQRHLQCRKLSPTRMSRPPLLPRTNTFSPSTLMSTSSSPTSAGHSHNPLKRRLSLPLHSPTTRSVHGRTLPRHRMTLRSGVGRRRTTYRRLWHLGGETCLVFLDNMMLLNALSVALSSCCVVECSRYLVCLKISCVR